MKSMTSHIRHNPYFNRWFSAIHLSANICSCSVKVTILILIDGFLQYNNGNKLYRDVCHNPYFNRWFSAMLKQELTPEEYELSQSLF